MDSPLISPATDQHLKTLLELYSDAAPALPLHQRLQSEFPTEIRALIARNIQTLLTQVRVKSMPDSEIDHAVHSKSNGHGNGYAQGMQRSDIDGYLWRMRHEIATDEVLSTPQNFISHYGCLAPLIAHEMEQVASGEISPEYLDSVGSIFIDVNGMKTIVDCTSHAHACGFLQRIALILRNPSDAIQEFLTLHRLTMEAYTVGGDEFFLFVRSTEGWLHQDVLDELAQRIKQLVAEDTVLVSHVSFEDDAFLWRYAGLDAVTMQRIDEDPEFARSKRQEIKKTLPKKFSPSISTGTATLRDGLDRAMADRQGNSQHTMTFEQFAYSAHYATCDLADERQKQNKDRMKAELRISDPQQYEFLMRNAENRRLRQKILTLRAQVQELIEARDGMKLQVDEDR